LLEKRIASDEIIHFLAQMLKHHPLRHQELKGHQAKTKAELKVLAKRKLKKMANNPQQLRGIFFAVVLQNFCTKLYIDAIGVNEVSRSKLPSEARATSSSGNLALLHLLV